MATHDRRTYTSTDDVIEILIQRSEAIANFLRRLKTESDNEREQLLLDNLIRLQRKLCEDLRSYRASAPLEVRGTFSQYRADLEEHVWQTSHQIDEIVKKTLELNQDIYREVAFLAERDESGQTKTAYANLQNLVNITLRDIGASAQSVRDL